MSITSSPPLIDLSFSIPIANIKLLNISFSSSYAGICASCLLTLEFGVSVVFSIFVQHESNCPCLVGLMFELRICWLESLSLCNCYQLVNNVCSPSHSSHIFLLLLEFYQVGWYIGFTGLALPLLFCNSSHIFVKWDQL